MLKLISRGIFSLILICVWCLLVALNKIPSQLKQICSDVVSELDGNYQVLVDGRDITIFGTAPSESIIKRIRYKTSHIQGVHHLRLEVSIHPDTLLMQHLSALSRNVVLFDKNSDQIESQAIILLDTVSAYLRQYPQLILKLSGYADASGDSLHNMTLSEKRAQAVKQALVLRGVQSERILTFGYGALRSDTSMHFNDMARRVELTFWENHP